MNLDTQVTVRDMLRKSLHDINTKMVALTIKVGEMDAKNPMELLGMIFQMQAHTSEASNLVIFLDSYMGGVKGAHILNEKMMLELPEYVDFRRNVSNFGKAIHSRKATIVGEIEVAFGASVPAAEHSLSYVGSKDHNAEVIDIFSKEAYNISTETLQ